MGPSIRGLSHPSSSVAPWSDWQLLANWACPEDVLPEFTPAYVEIQTESLGLSAAEVEQLLTVPHAVPVDAVLGHQRAGAPAQRVRQCRA